MQSFDYHAPTTLPDAIALMGRFGEGGKFLAGGTDLLVEIREGRRHPGHLINLKRIVGLDRVAFDDASGLQCGALATIRAIEKSPMVQSHYRGLALAAQKLGSVQIRNRATLGGNICRASPSADTLPPLIAAGAEVLLLGLRGSRAMALEDFLTGPGRTAMAPDEIVTAIRVPPPKTHTGQAYLKLGRRKAMELATAGVAVQLTLADDAVEEIRIVLGAVGPTPLRAHQAEAALLGRRLDEGTVAAAAAQAMADSRPISDLRASADYRRQMVGVLTARALHEAAETIR